jgi:hypothetical protein
MFCKKGNKRGEYMASLIIPAKKSITITDKFPTKNINRGIMSIGNDGFFNYISYLFFDLSSIPNELSIAYAELVLFKVDKFYNDYNKLFGIYSINEYFSTYTTFKNYPKINPKLKKDFYPLISRVAVTVPITPFVRLWLKDYHVNTSLMLCGKNKNSLVHFGSARCPQKYLIPFIKVTFNQYDDNKILFKEKDIKRITLQKAKNKKNHERKKTLTSLGNSINSYNDFTNNSYINNQANHKQEEIIESPLIPTLNSNNHSTTVSSEAFANSLNMLINIFHSLITNSPLSSLSALVPAANSSSLNTATNNPIPNSGLLLTNSGNLIKSGTLYNLIRSTFFNKYNNLISLFQSRISGITTVNSNANNIIGNIKSPNEASIINNETSDLTQNIPKQLSDVTSSNSTSDADSNNELTADSFNDLSEKIYSLIENFFKDNNNLGSLNLDQYILNTVKSLFTETNTYDKNPNNSFALNNAYTKFYSLIRRILSTNYNGELSSTINKAAEQSSSAKFTDKTSSSETDEPINESNTKTSEASNNENSSFNFFNCIFDNFICCIFNSIQSCCNIHSVFRQVHVIGTVAPYSKYVAVVNLSISRHCPRHTDNYYVTDEYDNSLNNNPLCINKIYNIAIVPVKSILDTEELSYYGSYKE